MEYKLIKKGDYLFTENEDAHLPLNGAAILDLPLLPPLEQEDDVEKLANTQYKIQACGGGLYTEGKQDGLKEGFIEGYNKAKEKYKYTEEDIQKAFTYCAKYAAECVSSGVRVDFLSRLEMYLESLSQSKMPVAFECKMDTSRIPNGDDGWKTIETGIKTTTNSQGQEVLVGEYVY